MFLLSVLELKEISDHSFYISKYAASALFVSLVRIDRKNRYLVFPTRVADIMRGDNKLKAFS